REGCVGEGLYWKSEKGSVEEEKGSVGEGVLFGNRGCGNCQEMILNNGY
ncbi:2641_t:CDS:1, partial [Gigaspora margarita]